MLNLNLIRRIILESETTYELRVECLDAYVQQMIEDSRGIVEFMPGVKVTPSQKGELQEVYRLQGKIPAIKMLRTLTNCGLKEAKDAIEDTKHFVQYPYPTR
jgi:ribosomal protein L7/L12